MVADFVQFLKDNDCLEKFNANSKTSAENMTSIYIIKSLYISTAFSWEPTPEKYTFWKDINEKWKKLLDDEETI